MFATETEVVDGVVTECSAPVELSKLGNGRSDGMWGGSFHDEIVTGRGEWAYLCADDDVVALPAKLLDGLAHGDLAAAV